MIWQIIEPAIKGILVGLFMAVSVGPTLLAILKYSMDNSYKAALSFVLGVSFSDILYVLVANLATDWLKLLGNYTTIITYAGASILMGVGMVGFISKVKPIDTSNVPKVISGGHYVRVWLSGFLINTLNPGVITSWLFAVTATLGSTISYRIILFGTCLTLILGIDFLKILLASKIKNLLTQQLMVKVQRISSVILFILGAMLLVKTFLKM